MADLRAHLEKAGFSKVETYIQSGNVAFNARKTSEASLVRKIEKVISDNYDFEVPVQVRQCEDIEAVLVGNPFLKEGETDLKKLYVTFLAEMPTEEKLEKIKEVDYLPDRFEIDGRTVFVWCEKYGSTKLSNTFFERKLKVSATTRNWKTVNKLREMGEV